MSRDDVTAETARLAPSEPGSTQILEPDFRLEDDDGAAAEAPPGTRFGRYVVVGRLGQGGMGVVYKAFDPQLDRVVALKVLRATRDGPLAEERLLREAQAMAQLTSPNVVHVYDVGRVAGELFIAMELIRGVTLREWLTQPRDQAAILATFAQAARGLAAAHAAGLVHRDFKPANVMLADDGRVVVLDFGLARAIGGDISTPAPADGRLWDSALTKVGSIVGTPAYMSPEQLRGDTIDARSDQFSFCVALAEALLGVHPFGASSTARRARMSGTAEPALDAAPRWLRQILSRGLAADPEARFASIEALAGALAADPRLRWRRRAAITAAFAAVGLAVAVPVLVRAPAAAPCASVPAELDGVYDDAARGHIRAAFAATGRPHAAISAQRVRERLDAYADEWLALRTRACRAANVEHTESAQLFDRRMACLDRRRHELRALVGVLARADGALVDRALSVVEGLAPVSSCADRDALLAEVALPDDPATRAEIAALYRQLAELAAQIQAGRLDEVRAPLQAVTEQAREIGHPPLHAAALLEVGMLARLRHRSSEALEAAAQARMLAAQARDPRTAARAGLMQLWEVTAALHDHATARVLIEEVEVTIHLAGAPWQLVAGLDQARGDIARAERDLPRAAEAYQRAFDRTQHEAGPDAWATLLRMFDLGIYAELDQPERSLAIAEEYAARCTRVLGPNHPLTAQALSNLAYAHAALGDIEQGLALREQERAITEAIFGPDDLLVGYARLAAGMYLTTLGRTEQAIDYLHIARETFERIGATTGYETAMVHAALARAHLDAGNLEPAREHAEKGRRDAVAAVGAEHASIVEHDVLLALVAVAADDIGTARAAAARAEALLPRVPAPTGNALYELAGDLGRAALATGDRERARAHFDQVVALFEKRPRRPVEPMIEAVVGLAALADDPTVAGNLRERAVALTARSRMHRAARVRVALQRGAR